MDNKASMMQKLKAFPVTNFFITNIGMIIALILLSVFFGVLSPSFFSANNVSNILRQISINAIIAFGMTGVLLIGGIDLSVGSMLALTGCTAVLVINAGGPVVVAVLAALGIGLLGGFLNGLIITKIGLPPFIVTLAMMSICRGAAYLYSDGKPSPFDNDTFSLIGTGYVFDVIPIPVVIMVAILIVMSILLNKTRFGRNIYAMGGNRECARFSGIKIGNTEIAVYSISGVLAAVSGLILTTRLNSGQPMVGEGYEMDAIAAAVLGGTSFSGGIGYVGGTMIGALVLGVLSNGMNMLEISYYWQQVVKGIIILIAVYIDAMKKTKRTTVKRMPRESDGSQTEQEKTEVKA